MCGIAGIRKMSKRAIEPWQLKMMVTSLEYRGNDATGMALMMENGSIRWIKNHTPAWQFIVSQDYKDWEKDIDWNDVRTAIVHTRKATKGTPFKNTNNHPLVVDPGAAVVHNGVISNDDFLFDEMALDRGAETDSDIIRAIVQEHGLTQGGIRQLNRLCGSVAAGCLHPDFPKQVLLLRSGSPLILAATQDYLSWASDKRTLHRVTKTWKKVWGMPMYLHAPDLHFLPVPNNSAYLIGPDGLEWHDKFSASNYGDGRGQTYRVYEGNYQKRMAELRAKAKKEEEERLKPKADPPVVVHHLPVRIGAPLACNPTVQIPPSTEGNLPDIVICPNPSCRVHIQILPDQRRLPLYALRCDKCNSNLHKKLAIQPVN